VAFSPAELRRYSRHLTLPEFGLEGQQRLKAGRVLCIGVGGLGSPAALYLAAAGVGTLGLVDFDVVDESNLQRQVIHATPDIGRSKLASAHARLSAINPEIDLVLHEEQFGAANAMRLVSAYDVILDGTDNFGTRYLVNDACVMAKRPNAYGSIFRFEGQAAVFAAPGGPCYRCLHPEPPPPGVIPNCAEGGVLGVLPGIIGTIQATEAIKLLTGIGEPLIGRFLVYDALKMRFRELKLRRDPDCPVCGDRPTITELRELEGYCAPGAAPETSDDMKVGELKALIDSGKRPVILDVREPSEFEICHIDGATLIPLRQLPGRLAELDKNADIVVHCKSGGRSAIATALMRAAGFSKARNLSGGILRWIAEVDPTLPKY
jgi:adenylyltransferase/sulfurtransferase